MFDIEEELKKLPAQPGVYIMHGEQDEIIYVGKARILKNRVRQYFQSSRGKTEKIRRMISHIRRFEYIVTDSELEALVLECNLIKEHRPPYNTLLKDDKAYPYIRVTVHEAFPRVLMARQKGRDKDRYFGPYSSVWAVRETIDLLHRLFSIRTCSRRLPEDIGKKRPCLNHHIGRCKAPCQGYIGEEEYRKSIQRVVELLSGHMDSVIKDLSEKMETASADMDYEKAIEYRDLIENVKKVSEKQKINARHPDDVDIIGMAKTEDEAVIQVFFMREGRIVGREHYHLDIGPDDARPQILSGFIKQFYAGAAHVPAGILLGEETEDAKLLSGWLFKLRGSRVELAVPKKGDKASLCAMAEKNARMVLTKDSDRIRTEETRTLGAVRRLSALLGVKDLHRMEAYDISNTSGMESVGSMVVFEDGIPKKSDYRKFKIRTVLGPNDYASLKEVLKRRFERGLQEKADGGQMGFCSFPDLILMDGGRGQVNMALEVLGELGLWIPVCGMVKDDRHRTRGIYYDGVELPIDKSSEEFLLVTRMQDEAHRFAIEFHRSLRGKDQVRSVLDDIPGIGPVRRRGLMRHFKCIEAVRAATEEELMQAEGMDRRAAKRVAEYFAEIDRPGKDGKKA